MAGTLDSQPPMGGRGGMGGMGGRAGEMGITQSHDAAVKAGTMTQAQADTMKSSLTGRMTDQVNGVCAGRGPGRGAGYAPRIDSE